MSHQVRLRSSATNSSAMASHQCRSFSATRPETRADVGIREIAGVDDAMVYLGLGLWMPVSEDDGEAACDGEEVASGSVGDDCEEEGAVGVLLDATG